MRVGITGLVRREPVELPPIAIEPPLPELGRYLTAIGRPHSVSIPPTPAVLRDEPVAIEYWNLVDLFNARFDPARARDPGRGAALDAAWAALLAGVENPDEDRILRFDVDPPAGAWLEEAPGSEIEQGDLAVVPGEAAGRILPNEIACALVGSDWRRRTAACRSLRPTRSTYCTPRARPASRRGSCVTTAGTWSRSTGP